MQIDLKFVGRSPRSPLLRRLLLLTIYFPVCTYIEVATMGGAKRMSKEEKRQAVLGIYHTTKQVYTENEILKLAAKEGIAQGA